jgi:hypothetical protein
VNAERLTIILAVVLGFVGICYLGVRYDNTVASRIYYFELRDPCRPNGVSAAAPDALPSDAAIQQKMAGAWWHCTHPHYFEDKLIWRISWVTVTSNGDYVCHLRYNDGMIYSNAIEGHWRVKDGLLFDTITNRSFSFSNHPVHEVTSNWILRATDRELVYQGYSDDEVVLFRRVRQISR